MNSKGIMLILSGPSGSGKGTVVRQLLKECGDMRLSVSATTREPRPEDTDGVTYYFMDNAGFEKLIEENGLLEYAQYCGNYYGTPRKPVDSWLDDGKDVIVEIEIVGAEQIKSKRPEAVSVFLLPPSMEELECRLRGRGTEEEEVILKRLARAKEEVVQAGKYDYCVINDAVENAVSKIKSIIAAEKCKQSNNNDLIDEVLKNEK